MLHAAWIRTIAIGGDDFLLYLNGLNEVLRISSVSLETQEKDTGEISEKLLLDSFFNDKFSSICTIIIFLLWNYLKNAFFVIRPELTPNCLGFQS